MKTNYYLSVIALRVPKTNCVIMLSDLLCKSKVVCARCLSFESKSERARAMDREREITRERASQLVKAGERIEVFTQCREGRTS